jgi:hypothetical protein
MLIAASPAVAQTSAPPPHDGAAHASYQKFPDLKRTKLIPEPGDASAEITILHVDPKSGATQLMIRSPLRRNFARQVGVFCKGFTSLCQISL